MAEAHFLAIHKKFDCDDLKAREVFIKNPSLQMFLPIWNKKPKEMEVRFEVPVSSLKSMHKELSDLL